MLFAFCVLLRSPSPLKCMRWRSRLRSSTATGSMMPWRLPPPSKLDARSSIPKIFKIAKRSMENSRFVILSLDHPARYRRQRSSLPGAVPFISLRTSHKETHNGEEIWNTENWERMDRRFPHLDLDAWECPLLMDQRMTRNHFEFFADI